VISFVGDLDYDVTVLTGDYRARTYGPIEQTMMAMKALRARLRGPVWGILGNHDTIRLLPELEAIGIRMLLNEHAEIKQDGDSVWLAGVDDDNHFAAAEMRLAADGIPPGAFSIVLSHTPETYREAEASGFDLLLAGHTHGGQICLPGGGPLTLAASGLPRRLGRGAWRSGSMHGYTSAGVGCSGVPVRFNCPPEITLHRLERSAGPETGVLGRSEGL
jgi:predicted MPP superfamily phosphohydrolase